MTEAGDSPTGTVTFVFTDVQGSTRLWEDRPNAMQDALARHDEVLRVAIEVSGGYVVKTTGDGFHAAFARPADALVAARDAQLALAEEDWGPLGDLRVRMGIHTGIAVHRDGDYYGSSLNRAARLMSVAHGGQIVVSRTTIELLDDGLPEGVTIVDLGEHRLRDLQRPEHVFQLCADGLEAVFPPLASLDALPGNLPAQLTSFVGREGELAAIRAAFGRTRMVTLTGVGGVGKTRLALHAAADLSPEHPDGAWYCELAAASDRDSMSQVLASTLSVRPRPGSTLEQSVIEFLDNRRVLLLLDNCEHLLDPAGSFAAAVLLKCPHVHVLATSREGLSVDGEQILSVRSLPVADDTHEGSVALFLDRARAVHAGFDPDAANHAAIVDVCRRLDGIPLAIELAAARVGAMTATDIADLLDERFRLLTGGRRTAVERHQTLRAAVDWSYATLDDDERQIFDRLGVFAGSFDANAAVAVATEADTERFVVLDALSDLVAKSMIVSEQSGVHSRYQMLETLRQYARDRLDERGESDEVRHRHADHYAARAEQLNEQLIGPGELDARLTVAADDDNFRAAVAWGLDRGGDDAITALRIVGAFANEAIGNRTTGVGAWALRGVEAAATAPPTLRHATFAAASAASYYNGRFEEAGQLAASALDGGIPRGSRALTTAHTVLALRQAMTGAPDQALAIMDDLEEAFNDLDVSDYHWGVLAANRATWAMIAGRPELAREFSLETLASARRTANPSLLTAAHFVEGWAISDREPERAVVELEASVELTHRGASDALLIGGLSRLAAVLTRLGESRRAMEALREAVVYAHDIGDRPALVAAACYWGASALVGVGAFLPAATLAGVLDGPMSVVFGGYATGADRTEHEASLAKARDALEPEHYHAAYEAGAAMSYEELVSFLVTTIDEHLDSRSPND